VNKKIGYIKKTFNKLSKEKIEEIIKLAQTKTISDVARIYEVDHTTVLYHLKKNKEKYCTQGLMGGASNKFIEIEISNPVIPKSIKKPSEKLSKNYLKYRDIIEEPICKGYTYKEYCEIAKRREEGKLLQGLKEKDLKLFNRLVK
jgi:DNA-binding transcriptional ArsR family regulator